MDHVLAPINDFSKEEQKAPAHVKFNPNGRIPTLIDHKNNDLVLWYVLCPTAI